MTVERKTMEKNKLPIAFFDSGVGGISVLREAVKLLPNEDYLFSATRPMRPTEPAPDRKSWN
jgi:glutamate racemase